MTIPTKGPFQAVKCLVLVSGATLALALWVGGIASRPAMAQTQPAPTPDQIARARTEQQAPRKVVPFDPTHFDKYVGYYQLGPRTIFKITRDGGKFYAQLTGQNPVQNYPESETKFFSTVVAAQISFIADARGQVTELVLHQNGLEQHAGRISQDAAQSIESALAKRVADQRPAPGSEAALRRLIDELGRGQPDYDQMSSRLAAATRQQLTGLQGQLARLGALQSVTFKSVGSAGNDIYELVFAKGASEWRIGMTPDGKIESAAFQIRP